MSYKNQRRFIQKRSFLLFELLISVGLLLLCLFPLIKTHVGMARVALERIKTLKEQQEVEAAFCLLKTKLYEHVYSWEELMEGVKTDVYAIEKMEQSTKHSSESGLVLALTLYFGKKSYERRVYVEKTRYFPH